MPRSTGPVHVAISAFPSREAPRLVQALLPT